MKTNIQEYLKGLGFIPFRYDTKNNDYKECYRDNHFSTMTPSNLSYLSVYYKKEKETFIFGLREANKPPTLISPRPKIVVNYIDNNDVLVKIKTEIEDDAMNICLLKQSPLEILEAIKNNTTFRYTLNEN